MVDREDEEDEAGGERDEVRHPLSEEGEQQTHHQEERCEGKQLEDGVAGDPDQLEDDPVDQLRYRDQVADVGVEGLTEAEVGAE